jgi:LemA protein
MMGVLIVVAVVVVGVLVLLSAYNHLVAQREQVRAAWAQIDVLLKRRYDLIPNLVETVKGYAAHERQTLEAVIAARNQAVTAAGSGNPQQLSQAEGALTGALRQLFAVAEAYPDLKANTNFLELQRELTNTENTIGQGRQQYNALVASYNAAVLSFPNNLLAGPFGFQPQPFFEIQDAVQREAPVVKFT